MKPLYVIVIVGILVGAGFYYRDTLAQKVADLYPSQTIPPTPNLAMVSPTPSPTATPAPSASPTPAPTATPVSIANIPAGQPLPKAGPEDDLALLGAGSLAIGGTVRYLRGIGESKRKIRNIDIQ